MVITITTAIVEVLLGLLFMLSPNCPQTSLGFFLSNLMQALMGMFINEAC